MDTRTAHGHARIGMGTRGRARGIARALNVALALALALALVATLGASARAGADPAPGDAARIAAEPLRVLAAASLTEVVEGLAKDFAGGPVATSFGASSDLARQIRDGAPADVFVSASPDWVAFLREAGQLAGEPVLLARNALVCAAPAKSPLVSAGVGDPGALLARLGADELVAIADAGVPAGDYARRSLAKLGLEAAFEKRLVGQKDVRAVLHAVEQGEVAAGFVYATDARVARVETLFVFDPATHPPIEYHAVLLRGAARPEVARRFLEHLESEAARARLSAVGFVLP